MRRWFMLAAVPLALLAGCAQGGAGGAAPLGSADADFKKRAAEVAEAWRASGLDESWRYGFYPLEDLTVLPRDAGFSNETKMAYGNGWFRTTARLSTKAPAGGTIRFADGDTLSVPLTSEAQAYRAIDRGDPPPCSEGRGIAPEVQPESSEGPAPVPGKAGPSACTSLTVTGVKLGTVRMRTSRGEATVPAWLFTVDEISGPLARVAVAPPAVPSGLRGNGWMGMPGSVTVDGAKVSYPVLSGCVKDITPLVYEAEDLVVVGARTTRRVDCVTWWPGRDSSPSRWTPRSAIALSLTSPAGSPTRCGDRLAG
jgi:hypothetical protein